MSRLALLYDAQTVGPNHYPSYQITHNWAHAQGTDQEDGYDADEEQEEHRLKGMNLFHGGGFQLEIPTNRESVFPGRN